MLCVLQTEELIAELGSAFLMADLGVSGDVQHENYIASWLKALKNDISAYRILEFFSF